MSDATLSDLYDAVFAAVEALGPAGTSSFKQVVDFGGELTAETISQAVGNRVPAALIAVASGDPEGRATLDTTTGEMQTVERTALVIYVAVQSVRGAKQAHDGVTGSKGLFALCGEVEAAVNGLAVAGLWGTRRVHYAGLRPVLFRPGNQGVACVYALRFQAQRLVAQTTPTVDTDPFERFDGEVNPLDASATLDAEALPLATIRADNLDEL